MRSWPGKWIASQGRSLITDLVSLDDTGFIRYIFLNTWLSSVIEITFWDGAHTLDFFVYKYVLIYGSIASLHPESKVLEWESEINLVIYCSIHRTPLNATPSNLDVKTQLKSEAEAENLPTRKSEAFLTHSQTALEALKCT